MKCRTHLLICSILTVGICVCFLCWIMFQIRRWNAETRIVQMVERLRKENTIGSHESSVLKYLTNNKIEHSAYISEDKSVRAIIRYLPSGWVIQRSLQISFFFDQNDCLNRVVEKEMLTGP